MLSEIRIRGLGVIEDVTLELGPGLTVVTGETGAGKTMVVTGLYLLFGGRADPARVRSGSGRAVVDGRLRLPADSPVLARAVEAGAEVDEDGELLVSRAIAVEGRSPGLPRRQRGPGRAARRAVRGRPGACTGSRTSCGCSSRPSSAPPWTGTAGWSRCWSGTARRTGPGAGWPTTSPTGRPTLGSWPARPTACARGWPRSPRSSRSRGRTRSWPPRPDKLAHADALRLAAQTAHGALAGDPADPAADGTDVTALLGAARRALAHESAADPELAALEKRLDELAYLVADVGTELASYGERLDADPARLAAVEERRAELKSLVRKFGDVEGTVEEVLAWAATAAERLVESGRLRGRAGRAGRRAGRGRGRQTARARGRAVPARHDAAERFGKAVTDELAGLAMPAGRGLRRRAPEAGW